jgi:nucleotide-binding universal stress UspA family protein
MSYILVATDFSALADNAVSYAARLAAWQQRDLIVFHTYTIPILPGEVMIASSIIEEMSQQADEQLQLLTRNLAVAHPGLTIRAVGSPGPLSMAINKYADEHGKPWVIVMGNSNTVSDSSWFFSTLNEATNAINASILAIPPSATFKHIKNICLAIDFSAQQNTVTLGKLSAITDQCRANLHVLHISQTPYTKDNLPLINPITQSMLEDNKPEYHFRVDEDIDHAIHDFCHKYHVDILAVVPGDYSLFEGLFHHSHTKALAKMMEIPLLIMHENR